MVLTDDDIAQLIFGKADHNDLSLDQLAQGQLAAATAEKIVFSHVGPDLASAAREEVLSAGRDRDFSGLLEDEFTPDRTDVLVLKHTPVDASSIVVKVNEDKQDFSSITALPSDEYQLEDVTGSSPGYSATGILRRISRQWPSRPGGVLVTYTGGLDTSGREYELLKKAIAEVAKVEHVRHRTFMENAGGEDSDGRKISSESIGHYSVSYDNESGQKGLPQGVLTMLDELRNYTEFL